MQGWQTYFGHSLLKKYETGTKACLGIKILPPHKWILPAMVGKTQEQGEMFGTAFHGAFRSRKVEQSAKRPWLGFLLN